MAIRSKLFLRPERGYKPSFMPNRQITLKGMARMGSIEQKVTPPVRKPVSPAMGENRSSREFIRKDRIIPRLTFFLKYVRFCNSLSLYSKLFIGEQ
jgi:hypothetical protein